MKRKKNLVTTTARQKILKSLSKKQIWQCKCGPCADSCTSGDRCS